MISGALFLDKDISFSILISKYIRRIFIHFLSWSLIYTFIDIKSIKFDIKKIIFLIIKGHYHLWYLLTTIGLYFTIPFTREIIKNNNLFHFLLFSYFILLFIIPNYVYLFRFYSPRIYKLLNYLISVIYINNLSVNYIYFIFGYYLNMKKGIKKELNLLIYITGLIGLYFTTKISYEFSFAKKRKIIYYRSNYLNIFFYSISIFVAFKQYFNNNTKIIQKIAKFTFGVYLIHPLIIEKIMDKKKVFDFQFNIIFLIPIISLIIFLLCLIISIILYYIPFIGIYLV